MTISLSMEIGFMLWDFGLQVHQRRFRDLGILHYQGPMLLDQSSRAGGQQQSAIHFIDLSS